MGTRYKSPVRSIEVEQEDGSAKVYTFALTLDAIAKLQELWEIDDFGELQKRLDKPTTQSVKDVVFACMWAIDQETNRDKAEDFCRQVGVSDLMELVSSIVQSGTPPPEVGDGRPTTAKPKGRR